MAEENKLTDLTGSLNKFLDEFTGIITKLKPAEDSSAERSLNTSREITGEFSLMLGFTKGMLDNMGAMQTGFAKTVDIILGIINSISGNSSGGFGGLGLFSGLLGIIGGIFGGPLGAAAGGAVGALTGKSVSSGNIPAGSQFNSGNLNNIITPAPQFINQVVIKNPVTFQKAFDVEVRTRELRGGIDL